MANSSLLNTKSLEAIKKIWDGFNWNRILSSWNTSFSAVLKQFDLEKILAMPWFQLRFSSDFVVVVCRSVTIIRKYSLFTLFSDKNRNKNDFRVGDKNKFFSCEQQVNVSLHCVNNYYSSPKRVWFVIAKYTLCLSNVITVVLLTLYLCVHENTHTHTTRFVTSRRIFCFFFEIRFGC